MNIHSLAKTTPAQRREMVRMVREQHRPVEEAAERFTVSVRTVYKWLARHRDEGVRGLQDRSSRPSSSPRKLAAQLLAKIVHLRVELQLRATQIALKLALARSTVAAWLKKLKLLRLPRPPHEPVQRYEHDAPGALIHLDIKKLGRIETAGHAVTGDRSKRSRGAGWEYLHVCIDDHSRYAYCEILADEKAVSADDFLRRATTHFAALGVSVRAVLTDNGKCYHSNLVKATCKAQQIKQRFTRPYRPQTNGKAERFIRTALEECLRRYPYNHSSERWEALKTWLTSYNLIRPHSAIGNLPPASRIPALNNLSSTHT